MGGGGGGEGEGGGGGGGGGGGPFDGGVEPQRCAGVGAGDDEQVVVGSRVQCGMQRLFEVGRVDDVFVG